MSAHTPTFSSSQNLGNVQPTPSISTRNFEILPGQIQTLNIVGTSVYVSECYTLDADGYQIPAAVKITLGHCEPFYSQSGTTVEFKYYGTPFNKISLEGVGAEKVWVTLQVGYMLEVRKGDAGTAGAVALLASKIEANKEEIERLLGLLDGKQDVLTWDAAPRRGSGNPVTSNGIFQALLKKLSIETWNGDGESWWRPNEVGTLNLGNNKRIHGLEKLTWDGGFESLFQKDKSGTLAFLSDLAPILSRIEALENTLANLSTGAAFYLAEDANASGGTIAVPVADETLNGEVAAETNTDWLSADSSGNITVEAL